MKAKNKILSLLALLLLSGLFCLTVLQAEEPKSENTPVAPVAELSSAEIEQHYDYYGDTKVIMVKPVTSRMFSHVTHFITNKLSCETCHDSIFEREYGYAATQGDYTMDAMEQGKYCGVCHGDGEKATAFNLTSPENCIKCHETDMVPQDMVVFTIPVQTVIFNHKDHVDRQPTCHSCHEKVFKSKKGDAESNPDTFIMDEMYKGNSCGVCHNGTDAFAASTRCTLCHIGVKGEKRLVLASEGKQENDNH